MAMIVAVGIKKEKLLSHVKIVTCSFTCLQYGNFLSHVVVVPLVS